MQRQYSALCCYFGQWPNYFPLWLKSCSYNNFITFFLVTDIPTKEFNIPDNVIIINKSFLDIQSLIHNTFDHEILAFNGKCANIDRPYKLCEYKTAYGWLFRDIFQGYEYWGYYDIDLLWGDLKSFMPNNTDSKYVKIFPCGHLSFIKNVDPYNRIYSLVNNIISKYEKQEYHGYRILNWQDAFSSSESMFYDEEGGLEPLAKTMTKDNQIDIYHDVTFDNILPPWNFEHFQIINFPEYRNVIYSFESGHIYRHYLCKCSSKKTEISYLHISKRQMGVFNNLSDNFLVIPNKFIPFKDVKVLHLLYYGRSQYLTRLITKVTNKLKRFNNG